MDSGRLAALRTLMEKGQELIGQAAGASINANKQTEDNIKQLTSSGGNKYKNLASRMISQ